MTHHEWWEEWMHAQQLGGMDPLDLRENQLMNLPNYWQLPLKCYEDRESKKRWKENKVDNILKKND